MPELVVGVCKHCGGKLSPATPKASAQRLAEHEARCADETPHHRAEWKRTGWWQPRRLEGPRRRGGRPRLNPEDRLHQVQGIRVRPSLKRQLEREALLAGVRVVDVIRYKLRQPLPRVWK